MEPGTTEPILHRKMIHVDASHNGSEVTPEGGEIVEISLAENRTTRFRWEINSRRNIVTRGVALNHLVGREFQTGEATLRGPRLCEPCTQLERLTQPVVIRGLTHCGGLRAQILTGGTIKVGDRVQIEQVTSDEP